MGNYMDAQNPDFGYERGLMSGSDMIYANDSTQKSKYSTYLDWYFDDLEKFSQYDIASSNVGALTSSAANDLIGKNKDWFPSITGVDASAVKTVSSYGAPMAGAKSSLEMEPSTIPMLEPSLGGGQSQQGAASLATPSGELSESVMEPTKTFAKGMADISVPNPTADVGSLLK
jgi:hypothetical protein